MNKSYISIFKQKIFFLKLSLLIFAWLIIFMVLSILSFPKLLVASNITEYNENMKIKETLMKMRDITNALEIFYTDWNFYPAANDIRTLISELKKGNYSEVAQTLDAWGNEFIYQSNGKDFQLISYGSDGIRSDDDIILRNKAHDANLNIQKATEKPLIIAHFNRKMLPAYNPGTVLYVAKTGNNIVLSWSGTGTTYDIGQSTDKYFFNSTLLALDIIGASYTYVNALINQHDQEYFDVTDETEVNRTTKNNGGDLPPLPPIVTVAPTDLYIGGPGIINGTNFSAIAPDNIIWFDGGIWTRPTSATPSQMNFTVPRGAVSGNLSVQRGQQVSDTVNSAIYMENYYTTWTSIRSMSYADAAGDYWVAGAYGSNNKVTRIFYNPSSKQWERNDRQADSYIYVCTPKTSKDYKIFCGVLTGHVGGVVKVATTYPSPSNVNACTNLAPGRSTIVHGAAVDPNPQNYPTRNVAYFALEINDTNPINHVYKIGFGCTGSDVINNDYGNMQLANFDFNTLTGMVVSQNGDLYLAERQRVLVIHQDESIEIVKSGFTSIMGIDVIEEGTDIAMLIIADNGTSTLSGVPLNTENLLTIATASSLRSATRSSDIIGTYDGGAIIRTIISYNDGGRMPFRGHPILSISPNKSIDVWISSPLADQDRPDFQNVVRNSTSTNPDEYSTVKVSAWNNDKQDMALCAQTADPMDIAGYALIPANPSNCDKANSVCDNKDPYVEGGPASFVDTNTYESCKSNCGGTVPCEFEFRITKRYAGDNYKILFKTPTSSRYLGSASVITAWKREFIEKDEMCRKGGILFPSCGIIKLKNASL